MNNNIDRTSGLKLNLVGRSIRVTLTSHVDEFEDVWLFNLVWERESLVRAWRLWMDCFRTPPDARKAWGKYDQSLVPEKRKGFEVRQTVLLILQGIGMGKKGKLIQ